MFFLQPVLEGDLGRSLVRDEVNIDTDVPSPFGERVVLMRATPYYGKVA